jgi:PTH1 family peptidyl-tRNA hydrolase
VLKRPSADHREAIGKAIEQSLAAAPLMMAGEMDKALAKVHAGPQRAHKPAPPKAKAAAGPDVDTQVGG